MKKFIFLFIFIFVFPSICFSKYTDQYDDYFRKYSKRYFGPLIDYRLFKSQAIAESNLNPKAVSPVGAKGLMQFMPPTWDDMVKRNSLLKGSIYNPKYSIIAGIYYNSLLWEYWDNIKSFADRICFMLASYNAGMGNISKAKKIASSHCNNVFWMCVKKHLHKITGDHSKETLDYVDKILRKYSELLYI